MKIRITAIAPILLPLAALVGACSSTSHPPPFKVSSALSAPSLGTAESFSVLGGQTVTNTLLTTMDQSLGVSPGSAVTGFPPGLVLPPGTIHAASPADPVAMAAQAGFKTAYDALGMEPCTVDMSGTDLGGHTLVEGVYCFTSDALLTGTLTLDAKGKADAVFIFKIVSQLTTATGSTVKIINGGSSCRVFWKVDSSAVVGAGTTFVGNILALTSISLKTGASLDGRAFARTGEVSLEGNTIRSSSCSAVDAGVQDTGVVDSGKSDATEGDADVGPETCEDPETCK